MYIAINIIMTKNNFVLVNSIKSFHGQCMSIKFYINK